MWSHVTEVFCTCVLIIVNDAFINHTFQEELSTDTLVLLVSFLGRAYMGNTSVLLTTQQLSKFELYTVCRWLLISIEQA